MSSLTKRALAVLLLGLGLGVGGEILRSWVPARLDFALWVGALLIGAAVLVRAGALATLPHGRWLAAAAWMLIPCFIWRDSDVLFGLNLLALAGLLILAGAGARIRSLGRFSSVALAQSAVWVAGTVAVGPVPALAADIEWNELPLAARTRRVVAIGAGLVAAAPVLVLFGALLASSDPLFADAISRTFAVDLGPAMRHLVSAGAIFWLAVGLLRGGFWLEGRGTVIALAKPELPPATLFTFVGAIGALLAIFVAFQAGELFLSAQDFQATMGMTISQYARKGFFELVCVAAIALPILLAADWGFGQQSPLPLARFHTLMAVVVVLLTLILASAFHRMTLYESFYGLTDDRFYTLAFMLWLAGVFGWFGATVLRGRRSRFLPGTVAGAFAVLAALNVANPDGVIAAVNLGRAVEGAPLDAKYLVGLSADAVPAMVRAAPRLPPAERCALYAKLGERWEETTPEANTAAPWNLSRGAAERALAAVRTEISACGPAAVPEVAPQGTDARL